MATDLYDKVKEVSEISNLPITYIVNRCIDYAIENVEVE
jgi:chaperone required for assembly of F1-ATPase